MFNIDFYLTIIDTAMIFLLFVWNSVVECGKMSVNTYLFSFCYLNRRIHEEDLTCTDDINCRFGACFLRRAALRA